VDSHLADLLSHVHQHDAAHGSETITILLSDHGNHMSPFFYLSQTGHAERSLPALFMLLPPSFMQRIGPSMVQQLERNQQTVLTAYDLYATFRHLHQLIDTHYTGASPASSASSPPPKASAMRNRAVEQSDVVDESESVVYAEEQAMLQPAEPIDASYSLFEHIPHRSCQEARIPPHVCICHAS
jgi:hypothetical protein